MFFQDLNQQFRLHAKALLPRARVTFAALFWNGLMQVITLGTFMLWFFRTSTRVRFGDSWAESQLLFAALVQFGLLWLFREHWSWPKPGKFLLGVFQGALFATLMMTTMLVAQKLEFLGMTSQISLNFLSNYSWVAQSFTIIAFLFAIETFFTLPEIAPSRTLQALLFVGICAIWFQFNLRESISLFLLFLFAGWFKQPGGFVSGFLFFIHAIFGQSIFGIEFLGLFQLKLTTFGGSFLEYHWVWIGLGLPTALPFLQTWLESTKGESKQK